METEKFFPVLQSNFTDIAMTQFVYIMEQADA